MYSLVDLTFVGMVTGAVLLFLSSALRINLFSYFDQISKYGKIRKSTGNNDLISRLDVPKSWFRHFYTFGSIYSGFCVYLTVNLYVLGNEVPDFVVFLFDLVYGKDRKTVGE